jgi:dTDP-4-dehydrorhamnose 3,5-epimerase
METQLTNIAGVIVLAPCVIADERGFFFESFNKRTFAETTGLEANFVQDNHSCSDRGVLRGLHYQVSPRAQGKLVRCAAGRVWDVAVDIRRSSPTFGEWFGLELSAENKRQLWLPEGMAHGFLALTDGAELLYKTTEYYAPDCDRSIRWDDPELSVDWPLGGPPQLSDKDRIAPLLADAEVFP